MLRDLVGTENLPNELLERILCYVSPYQDLKTCMLVSRRWRQCVRNVALTKTRNFRRALVDEDMRMIVITPPDTGPGPSKHCLHVGAIHANYLYVFGGYPSALWQMDLTTREWTKVRSRGLIPKPRAWSTMVCYKNFLVLFGGAVSSVIRDDLNDLHMYDLFVNCWHPINTKTKPPSMSYHSASVVGEWMVVLGGRRLPVPGYQDRIIWKFHLESREWYSQTVVGDYDPPLRMGHTQLSLNESNILLIAGVDIYTRRYSSRIWLLKINLVTWMWIPVDIRGPEYRPSTLANTVCCRVGDKLVGLGKGPHSGEQMPQTRYALHPAVLYVLDLSHVLEATPYVTWLPYKELQGGPISIPRYNLFLEGKCELVMYGGLIESVVYNPELNVVPNITCGPLRFITVLNNTI